MKKILQTIFYFLIVSAISSSQLVLADGEKSVPIEKEIISEIMTNYKSHLQQLNSKILSLSDDKLQQVRNMKEASEKAFTDNGYSFSATLSSIANDGFGFENEQEYNDKRETAESLLGIFITPIYVLDDLELLPQIYSKTDAKNILTLSVWVVSGLEAGDPSLFIKNTSNSASKSSHNSSESQVNPFSKEELDLHLRHKWASLQKALEEGDIEEASLYFVSTKRNAYKETFQSSQEVRNTILNLKIINIVEYDVAKVKYVASYDLAINGKNTSMGTYIIFVLDLGGQWKVEFF